MDWTAIFSAIIVGVFSLLGIAYQSNKTRSIAELSFKRDIGEIKKEIGSVKTDLEKLSEKVDKHNNFGLRIYGLEQEVRLRKEFCDDKWDRFEMEIRGGEKL